MIGAVRGLGEKMSRIFRLSTIAFSFIGVLLIADTQKAPVQAQGFLNGSIFKPQFFSQRSNRRHRSNVGYFWWERSQPRTPPIIAYVSPPEYYTYIPDTLVHVELSKLSEADVAEISLDKKEGAPAQATPINTPITKLPQTDFQRALKMLGDFKLLALPEVSKALIHHYKKNPEFIWVKKNYVNSRAYQTIITLNNADQFGLSSKDYLVVLPSGSATENTLNSTDSLIEFELNMSVKVLSYILDATRGRIDPNRLSGYHDFKRKSIELNRRLLEIVASDDIAASLKAQHPSNAPFKSMVSERAQLIKLTSQKKTKISAGTFVRPGEQNVELVNVVAAIETSGTATLIQTHKKTFEQYTGDPTYSDELVALVKDFQKERSLSVDGVIGPNTIRAMIPETNEDKIAKIELAMERLRWLPREFGNRHVFINQPAFMATYMHEDKAQVQMRIVVGTKLNQTNFFQDKIETIEYNPYWGVPQSIIINEMVPELYKDPYYLDRAGYIVTDSSGQLVSSSSVDWGGVATKTVPINVRQPPGNDNALGRVKILFPNKHNIYMHDTPHKNLFSLDTRAFSHGCVRLHAPRVMAAAILGKPVEYVDEHIAQENNHADKITDDIPVYISYFTAWPEADGIVQYYADMYGRDTYLTRAIEITKSKRYAES